MSAFVCARCKQPVRNPLDRFQRRIEFRGVRTKSRYRVLRDVDLCRRCVDAEVEEARPLLKQEGLW